MDTSYRLDRVAEVARGKPRAPAGAEFGAFRAGVSRLDVNCVTAGCRWL